MVKHSLKQAPDVIVFDMDGVLVEVGESYREAIRETIKHFTGELVSHDLIQDFKNAGGWNNDWLLSHRLIADRNVQVEYPEVVDYFNKIFLGEGGDGSGLIQREKWLPAAGALEKLLATAALAIFTGRAKYEADVTLRRHAPAIHFEPIVTDESVSNPKPAPDGLQLIKRHHPGKHLWYLGDTVDDANSALAANVAFIGVSVPQNPRHGEVSQILRDRGAMTVLSDVNELTGLIRDAMAHAGATK